MNEKYDVGHEYHELIRQVEAGKKYRHAFVIALVVAVALAISVVALWWRFESKPSAAVAQQGMPATETSNMTTSSSDGGSNANSTTAAQNESPLNPIQLSPQRIHSIGIQIGQVQSKTVIDEL